MFTAPPPATPVAAAHSWYLGDLDPGRLATLAKNDETAARAAGLTRAVVVLDAGDPDQTPGSTHLPDNVGPATELQIGGAASAYAYSWSHLPKADGAPLPLTLVIATSNFGQFVNPRSGAAWAQLVTVVRADNPTVDVAGGLDDEPGYGRAKGTFDWLKGYAADASHPFVDLGDCACTPGQALPKGWTLAQRAKVAEVGRVLPQQYRTSGIDATRWAYLDKSVGGGLQFLGVLTETRACAGPPARACTGIDQTPGAAEAGLTSALGRPVSAATDIGYLVAPPPVDYFDHRQRVGTLAGLATLVVLSAAYEIGRRLRRRGQRT